MQYRVWLWLSRDHAFCNRCLSPIKLSADMLRMIGKRPIYCHTCFVR